MKCELAPPRHRACRFGLHRWSITTRPIGVRWCFRCGKRDPERGDNGIGALMWLREGK